MTIHEGSDLLKRVQRYEAALDELQTAHGDVRNVLLDQILFERWRQLGAELGFAAQPFAKRDDQHPDLAELDEQLPQLSGSWAN